MTKIYAGIGSRSTPANICEVMRQLGQKLGHKGAVLRSGNAAGADRVFESGAVDVLGKCQIFLVNSWYSCGKNFPNDNYKYLPEHWEAAESIGAEHHPNWINLNPYPRRLHTRNCFQVLGWNLQSPADFVICWTPDGARTADETSQKTGGTGQAIRVASSYGVRVYNLAVKEDFELAQNWVVR